MSAEMPKIDALLLQLLGDELDSSNEAFLKFGRKVWQEAARQAMERAAKVCDERAETHHDLHTMNDKSIYWFDKAAEDRECADAIRALIPQSEKP